ncbi:hypothetical protein BGX27_000421 [Mortierella sp. AM989]|nr:hypothetical protein BGX27_000421 [Mortierella sp. AM989]
MNQITQTTKSTISTIKAHALLAKALSNDSKPTPGYLFPEIARLTQSPATSSVVLTQLLKTITSSGSSSSSSNSQAFVGSNSGGGAIGSTTGTSPTYTSSPHVLLKALKILRQLAQSGSIEFRASLARRGKGLLAEMVGYRGQWDEIHGDKFNEDVRTVAEDLLEYIHANPVQGQEHPESSEVLSDREAAVLKNSTQDLPGFGNPDYDDSDSGDDQPHKNTPRGKKKSTTAAAPPLPGFGNPAFEKDAESAEPTLMARLVDRLQEMAASPPPIAMRTAYRQQEQRRQKLFVGEYSMRADAHGRSKDGPITLMGTNPFKRTTRIQGVTAGGWGEKTVDISGATSQDYTTNRVFPCYLLGSRSTQFRNTLSEAVYRLAQHIQTDLVRSKFQCQQLSTGAHNLMDTTSSSVQQDLGSESLTFWGTAKEISDVVIKHLANEKLTVDHLGDITSSSPKVSAMTGLVRDLIDWIEQEDWERRIVAHPGTGVDLLNCPALPILLKTLVGPMCLEAPQRSVKVLSAQLASQIKQAYSAASHSRLASGKSPSLSVSDVSLLDIGA